jgi:predicted enzyme related to lactoylglutathione lyase
MSKSRWYTIVVDCHDIEAVASFWQAALGYERVFEGPEEIVLVKDRDTEPGLVFGTVPEEKTIKNRLHIDLAPDDQAAEVERLIALGATHVDVGQTPENKWVVLADPEGNEFCVLTAR